MIQNIYMTAQEEDRGSISIMTIMIPYVVGENLISQLQSNKSLDI